MNNDDERDYEEEAYNRHIMHTGDGEVENCTDPYCPYYSNKSDKGDDYLIYADDWREFDN